MANDLCAKPRPDVATHTDNVDLGTERTERIRLHQRLQMSDRRGRDVIEAAGLGSADSGRPTVQVLLRGGTVALGRSLNHPPATPADVRSQFD